MFAEKDSLEVVIDLMTKTDIPEIMKIEKEAFTSPWTEGMFVNELAAPHSQCLVARAIQNKESMIAGYLIFWIVADEAHLHNLAVRKEFRRQGLAKNFLMVMKEISFGVGVKAQTLEVRESNIKAISLYQKCGYVIKGKRSLYYTDTREDALIMWAQIR